MITYLTVSVAASLGVRIHLFKTRDALVELAHYRRVVNLTWWSLALIVKKTKNLWFRVEFSPLFFGAPGLLLAGRETPAS